MHKKTLALEWRITKVSKNKKTPAKVYSCGFCKTFKNTFSTEHFHGLGVCLAANEFFSKSKNYLCSSVSPFSSFSIFCVTCFFYKLSFWTPQHEERSIQSNYQEVPTKWWFCWFIEEIYLGMNAGLWSSVCVCVCVCVILNFWELFWGSLWCLWTRKCLGLFFHKWYEFSASNFIGLSKFWCEVFAIIMGCLRI